MSYTRRVKGKRTPRVSSTQTGTIHMFDAVAGTDKIYNNGIQTQIRTKLLNLCGMTVYKNMSMEELRLEDYKNNQKFPLINTTLFPPPLHTTTNPAITTTSIFGSNTTTTSSTLGISLFENKPTMSTPFLFQTPVTTIAGVTTPFTFGSSSTKYFNAPFGSFTPGNASFTSSSSSLFTFENRQPTITTSTFDFALAAKELTNCVSNHVEEKLSTTQQQTDSKKEDSRSPSPDIVYICIDCKKTPHMQCLHCSKHVCIDCAQKHLAFANEQVSFAQNILTDKMSTLDQLSILAKERVNAERDKIVQQADIERDQALIQIDQLLEQQKKQIQDKSTQLSQLSLDKISSFIQRMTIEIEDLNEDNDQLFSVISTLPKIQVQHKS